MPDYWYYTAAALALLNLPTYALLGRWVFGDMDRFWVCVGYWFKPDIVSMLEGTWDAGIQAYFQMLLWLVLCIGAVALETLIIVPLVPVVFAGTG